MKTRASLLAFALAAAAGCTIVAPGSPDGGTKTKLVPYPVPIRPDALPPPKPLEASVLYVVNLQRSSANLAGQYAGIIGALDQYWQSVGLSVVNMGLISLYADQFGPRLLLGRNASSQQSSSSSSLALLGLLAAEADAGVTDYQTLLPAIGGALANIDDADLQPVLQLMASSGAFDGDGVTCEAQNVVDFGGAIDTIALPSQYGGIDRSAFFDTPHDLFIVVYLQPLPRRCAIPSAACDIGGRSPSDIFLDTDADGNATWLNFASGGISPSQVVQVAVATSEGESESDFDARCSRVPGFPLAVLDVIGPSPDAYFTPLLAALNAAHPGTGQSGDFCTLIGTSPAAAISSLGASVAALASSH